MESNLTDPLLPADKNNGNTCDIMSNQTTTTNSEWPSDIAKRTKLYIPPEYNLGDSMGDECILRYDSENKALVVVSDDNSNDDSNILDMFYTYDIIGADVEVKLLSSAGEELRSTTSSDGPLPRAFQNKSSGNNNLNDDDDEPLPGTPVEDDGNITSGGGGCGIFQPITQDIEKIFSTANNEPLTDIPFDTQATAILTIYCYPRKDPTQTTFFHSCFASSDKPRPNLRLSNPSSTASGNNGTNTANTKLGHRYAHHRRFQVAPAEDFSNLSSLVRAIRNVSRPTPCSSSSVATTEQRVLAVINPVSGGHRNGESTFDNVVAPMLEQAGITFDKFVTQYSKHAAKRMQVVSDSTIGKGSANSASKMTKGDTGAGAVTTDTSSGDSSDNDDNIGGVDQTEEDISKYTAIVTVGGDGIIHEVLQGIRARPDANQQLRKLKLGIIGTGTSNGLAMSLAHASKVRVLPLVSYFVFAQNYVLTLSFIFA